MNAQAENKTEQKDIVTVGNRGLEVRTMGNMWRIAQAVIDAKMFPKKFKTTQECFVAMQTGCEAGLSPIAALKAINVINGVPSWGGDAALGHITASGKMKDLKVWYTGKKYDDDYTCHVSSTRADNGWTRESTCSVADAKRLRLWDKKQEYGVSPWVATPDRMLYYRASGYHWRDMYSDILMGFATTEEVMDYQAEPQRVSVVSDAADMTAATEPDPLLAQLTHQEAPTIIETAQREIDALETEGVEVCPDTGEIVPPPTKDELF